MPCFCHSLTLENNIKTRKKREKKKNSRKQVDFRKKTSNRDLHAKQKRVYVEVTLPPTSPKQRKKRERDQKGNKETKEKT